MLLAKTELWQYGSDAPDNQQVLALDAATGEVYEAELEAMLQDRKDKQCGFRVTDAGFSSDKNMVILVRAKFFTTFEVDETESDVPAAKRCGDSEETGASITLLGRWSRWGTRSHYTYSRSFCPIGRLSKASPARPAWCNC